MREPPVRRGLARRSSSPAEKRKGGLSNTPLNSAGLSNRACFGKAWDPMHARKAWLSGGQPLAAFCAAPSENDTTVARSHARTETVGALALEIAGLECALHRMLP